MRTARKNQSSPTTTRKMSAPVILELTLTWTSAAPAIG